MPIEDRSYYRDDYQYEQRPKGPRSVVVNLIIINVAIFVIDAFTSKFEHGNWLSWIMSLKTDGEGIFTEKGIAFWQLPFWNVWQIFTYGFAHASISSETGIWHLVFNMLGLFFLGRFIEQRLGGQEFFKFYLLALFFAGVMSYAYNLLTGQTSSLVGASGAVVATVMLFVLYYPKQTLLIWGVLPAPAWVIGVLLIISDLFNAFNHESQVGWYAHLSGAMFAYLYYRLGWNFRWLKFDWITDRLSGKPRLKVHRDNSKEEGLKLQADKILEKLHLEGESSLTRKERKILEKYSQTVRRQRN